MNPLALLALTFIVSVSTLVFGYLVGRDNAEKDAEATIASLRAKVRELNRQVDLAREDAGRARRIAAATASRRTQS